MKKILFFIIVSLTLLFTGCKSESFWGERYYDLSHGDCMNDRYDSYENRSRAYMSESHTHNDSSSVFDYRHLNGTNPFNTIITLEDDRCHFEVKYISMGCIGFKLVPHVEVDENTINILYEIAIAGADSNGDYVASSCLCLYDIHFNIDKFPAGKYSLNIACQDGGETFQVVHNEPVELYEGESASCGVYSYRNRPKTITDEVKAILDRYFSETDDSTFDPEKARELGIL